MLIISSTLQTICPDVYRGPWGGANCRDSIAQTQRTCDCSPGEREGVVRGEGVGRGWGGEGGESKGDGEGGSKRDREELGQYYQPCVATQVSVKHLSSMCGS